MVSHLLLQNENSSAADLRTTGPWPTNLEGHDRTHDRRFIMGNRFAAFGLGDEAPRDRRDVGKFRDSLDRRQTEKLPSGT